MAIWYKITLAYKDCGVGGEGQRLQDAFATILIANGGKPWTAALFSQRSEDFEKLFYYFSPDAMQIAKGLIEGYKAVPCERPPRPDPITNHVNLSVGDARVFELLWPQEPQNS
jgi:hypothetical protein